MTTGPSIFKDVTWHGLVVGYRNFRTTTWLHRPGVSMKSCRYFNTLFIAEFTVDVQNDCPW